MMNIFYFYLNLFNKIITTNIFLYLLIINLFILFYLFCQSNTNFFKIIINFFILINLSLLISYLNGDFFSGFLLAAELPIILVLIVFYFHKNSLQIDNLYKYNVKKYNKLYFLPIGYFVFFLATNNFFLINFYNFLLTSLYNIQNKNDFYIIYLIYYKLNYSYIVIFAILIFFVSLLAILLYQLNKIFLIKSSNKKKSILFLRKQNLLKQAIYTSKLKFFNKKGLN